MTSGEELPTPEEDQTQIFDLLYYSLKKYSRCKVIFDDEIYPSTDGGDPERHCFFEGELLEIGVRDGARWASVRVYKHAIQSISAEAVAPGYRSFFHSMFTGSDSIIEAMQEEYNFIKKYPETFEYQELPTNEIPQSFLLKDMHSCIAGPLPKEPRE